VLGLNPGAVVVARVHSLVAANHGMPSSVETLSLKARKKHR
jgi:hypothetical protein